jgi:DNA-binding response OmpR family regulator
MADELAGKTVLLVDDDRDILAAMEAALSDLGPSIITAGDGDTALELADAHSPDLVIVDMMLPKRSGFLVMEKLKRGKKRTDPPRMIMITGNQGHRHKTYAESLGVDQYLNKPFRMEKLIESVKALIGQGR